MRHRLWPTLGDLFNHALLIAVAGQHLAHGITLRRSDAGAMPSQRDSNFQSTERVGDLLLGHADVAADLCGPEGAGTNLASPAKSRHQPQLGWMISISCRFPAALPHPPYDLLPTH
jgi:hypothetical protein